ncbi:MAG: B12-binding domain-containing radical SAM protein [Spirochaetales bacterium]|nr:B12-binding domain-containing radical SAM protein [Spirochaetales bacterium]
MKAKYFIPLICFLTINVSCSLLMMPPYPLMIIQFAFFLAGFSMTYYYAVKQTLKNRDAVIRLKQKSPYVMPVSFFIGITAVTTLLLIPRDSEIIVQFCGCCVMALLCYTVGVIMLLRDIKKAVNQPAPKHDPGSAGKKKLLLINPVNPHKTGLTVNSSSRFPPLALGIIAALTPDTFHVELIDENMERFTLKQADLVGITAFTSAAGRAYEIASHYRNKGIPVVMGGIHASMLPDEALRYVDTVVIGEAEAVWPRIMDDYLKGELKQRYTATPGELDNMPVARRDIFSSHYTFATVQTSRGCPMDCEFCSVTAFNGRKYRQRPVEDVLNELERIPQQYIFFVDDNIIGYSKASAQRAVRLFQGMVQRKLDKAWFCQASLNFGLNDDVLLWARKAGCKMVFLGLESPEPNELKLMNKKVNLRIDYKKALKNINKHKIAVLGAFINGTQEETAQSLKHKADYILHHPIDVIQTTILTPLPGTRLFRKLEREKSLLYTDFPADWGKYDMAELTFALKNLTQQEFMRMHSDCNRRFYSTWNLVKQFCKTLLHTKSMESALWAYNSNKNYRNVAFAYNK